MTIEQTVTIPNNYQISLELPHSVPIGVMAQVKINIPAVAEKNAANSVQPLSEIDDVRRLLHKEMVDKGTLSATEASGEGWEAYIKERYAEL